MSVEEILAPFIDISGDCHTWRGFHPSTRHCRPRVKKAVAQQLGILHNHKIWNVQRAVYFYLHPETDHNYTIVMMCGDNCCVNPRHYVLGLLNPGRGRP